MKSYNNAFELLTDDPAVVKLLTIKSNLMDSIVEKIHDLRINQSEAAKIMKVTQPRVSNLKNGRISKFSYDMLFLMDERIINYRDE